MPTRSCRRPAAARAWRWRACRGLPTCWRPGTWWKCCRSTASTRRWPTGWWWGRAARSDRRSKPFAPGCTSRRRPRAQRSESLPARTAASTRTELLPGPAAAVNAAFSIAVGEWGWGATSHFHGPSTQGHAGKPALADLQHVGAGAELQALVADQAAVHAPAVAVDQPVGLAGRWRQSGLPQQHANAQRRARQGQGRNRVGHAALAADDEVLLGGRP